MSTNPHAVSRVGRVLLLASIAALASFSWPGSTSLAQTSDPCSPPLGNAITCENARPGNPASEWGVSGAGDPSIQGFATQMSVNRGQVISFKINTSASAYVLDIYRLGYYSGLGARKVATVLPSASLPQNQPSCLSDVSTGLIDCGNWGVSASWTVPSSAVSGIYIAKATRTDTGGASHIVFVVRNDTGQSALLFQTSDTTWQAYNSYGGNSLYVGAPVGRAYKVSYNRPFNNQTLTGGPQESFLFNAEYPMLRWLEANGYDVSYTTGIDTHQRGGELREHRVFLSVGHDEYWSGTQRSNVEAARNAGVHLAFFSGNEVFWKTRWESSIDASGTPFRTLVSYKETHANAKIDPLPNVWTGTWRDGRFSPPADGGRPENELTGTMFMVNGPRRDAIRVPAAEGRLRFWRHTSIAQLPANQVATLPEGTLGYEWDVDANNGRRPAGLIRMSSTTLDVSPQYLLDLGSNYGSGIATHSLTLYKHGSGALVFGAGTVQWAWGLDEQHVGNGPEADDRMRQATVNLFADMGVQPMTLQGGLVAAAQSTDTTAPVSAITSPAAGSSVAAGVPFTIVGTGSDGTGGVVGGVEVSVDGGATWWPAAGREQWTFTATPTQQGTFTIRTRAIDDSGNIEAPSPGVTVTAVSDQNPPVISGVQASALATTANVTWNTSEPSDSQVEYGLTTAYGQLTPLNTTLVTSHNVQLSGLTAGQTYHYRVRSRDAQGDLAVSGDGTFTTPAAGACPCTLWPASATPAVASQADPDAVELGVRFRSDQDGLITGLRFYKGAGNTGQHIGHLWTTTGTLLAAATFTNESASGWQQVQFTTPVTIAANTTYIASYYAPNGGYAVNVDYFTGPRDAAPLHAPADTAGAGNGVFRYGVGGGFPNSTYRSSNYWVDVVFTTAADTTAPTISGAQVAPTTTGATVTWTTNEPADGQVEYGLTTAYGSLSPLGGVSTSHSIALTGLTPATTYHARVRSRDAAGNLATSGDLTFTTGAADTTAPIISAVQATQVTSSGAQVSWTTNEAANTQVEYGLTTSYGTLSALNTTLSTAHSVALTGLTGGQTYHYRVRSRDAAGNLAVSGDGSFTTPVAGACPCNLWPATATPAIASQPDTSAVELGVRFRSDQNGLITGLRFYKGAGNTGQHVGHLWSSTGTLLATATFTNETATGWQEVQFATPVAVTANTTYIASYYAPNGGYSVTRFYFTSPYDRAPLHAPASAPGAGNGLFHYGTGGGFPTDTFQDGNYWVDVVFTTAADTTAPTISGAQVAPTTTGATVTWTTNEPADGQVEYGLTTAYGSLSPLGGVSTSHSIALTGLTPATTYHARVRSRDAAGNLATSGDLTFTTGAADTTAPIISAVQATQVTSSGAQVSWTTNEAANTQVEYGLTTSYGTLSALNTTLSTAHSVALTGLTGGQTYHYRVRSRDAAGNLAVSGDGSFTTPVAGACPCNLWPPTATPAIPSVDDSNAVELGVRFRADQNGFIRGLRFYKGAGNTGQHVAHLWSSTGTLLATATFTNETATGWQEVQFATPVAVTANTIYIASYYAPNGHYSATRFYFTSPYDRAPLHAPASAPGAGNGLFHYGTGGGFPTDTFQDGNYWVDVVFVPGT